MYSCYHAFENNPFYTELPPTLQRKIVMDRLHRQISKFREFFTNYDTRELCPPNFMVRILSCMKCELWPVS